MSLCAPPSRHVTGHVAVRRAWLYNAWAGCGLWLAAMALANLSAVRADDLPGVEGAAPPIAFRRIFVPADNVGAWPRAEDKFLPVESRDFDAWIAAANQIASRQHAAAIITEAVYTARLEGDRLVAGRGQWTIALRGAGPAFLPLDSTSLVAREARWQGDAQRPARLGVWGPNGGQASNIGLEVSRAGILEFAWHVSTQTARGGVEASWRLPPATSTRLVLDLPDGMQPSIDGSVVLASSQLPPGDTSSDKPYRRWELGLEPVSATTLRITDLHGERAETDPTPELRDEMSYRLTERGLAIAATWHFDDSVAQRRELAVVLPPAVQLVSAAINGKEIPFRVVTDDQSAAAHALVALPKLDAPRPLTITVRAWHPLVLDRPWRLPTLRPDHVFWISGTIELSITRMLELRALAPRDCFQTGVSQASENATGPETDWFEAYSPAAQVEVTIAHRGPETTVRLGSILSLGEPDVSGRLVTQLHVARGSVHTLIGELAAGWLVEAVETIPANVLGEWFLDQHDGRHDIEIQLAQAARSGRGVTVVITGRLQQFGISEPLSAEKLRMVRWRDAHVARHLLTLQTIEPYVVEPIGDLPVAAAETMTDDDRAVLGPTSGEETVFDLTRGTGDTAVQLAVKRGQLEADIWLDATYANQELRQTFHLVCQPRAGRIDRLLIRATRALSDGVRWTERPSGMALSAERLSADDPRRAKLPAGGELWLVRLPQPTSQSVDITATQTTPCPRPIHVPMLSLPEAVEQRGRVLVRCEIGEMPELEPQGLRPIPLPFDLENGPEPNEASSVRAAYRYEPVECQDDSLSPKFQLGPSTAAGTSQLVVRRLELQSFYWSNGRTMHRATYHLENRGVESFDLWLPAGAKLVSLTMDGRALDLPVEDSPAVPLPIRLPSRSQWVALAVSYEAPQTPLAAGGRLTPPLLQRGMPLLAGEWTIWLPVEFAAVGADVTPVEGEFNWRQRLFGPLGRPSHERPFHPLRGADWSTLVLGVTGTSDLPPTSDSPVESQPVEPAARSEAIDLRGDAATGLPAVVAAGGVNGGVVTAAAQSAAPAPGKDQSTLAGWRAYHTRFVADGPAPVIVVHPPATAAWSISAFLLCLVCGRWMGTRRRVMFVALLATSAGLSLLLPLAFAPLATGTFLGLACSLIVDWPHHAAVEDAPTKTWNRLSSVGAGVLAIAVAIGWTSLSVAEPPVDTPAGASDTVPAGTTPDATAISAEMTIIHRVLIPVDAEGRPAGSKYYVSERFLRGLLRFAEEQPAAADQWLLRDAAYRGELRERADPPGVVAGDWTMTFDIEVLARDTTIVLPLVRNEATWPDTAAVDGIPAPIVWREDGHSCSIAVGEPGRYTLAISCAPQTSEIEGRNQVELTIPPFLGATLSLDYPAALAGLDAPVTPAARSENVALGVLKGELDRSGRLVVHWPRSVTPTGDAQGLRVTELRWLRIGVRDVELDTKYVMEGSARRPETLTVAFDHRWELLADANPPVETPVEVATDGQQMIRVPLPPDDIDRQEVTLRWRLADRASPGRLQLPPIELTTVPATQRWMAVSSDPALECAIENGDGTAAGTAREFLAMWGDAETGDEPVLVLGNTGANRASSLAVRPRLTEARIDEVLHVAAGVDALRVAYRADVVPGGGCKFGFPLMVSADLSVDEITLTQAGRKIPLRWSRESPSRVNVFFNEEVTEEYRLVLIGHALIAKSGECPLPRVVTTAGNGAMQRIQLYREDEVLVERRGLTDGDELKNGPLDLPPVPWTARPLAAYRLDRAASDTIRLAVAPNPAGMTGQTLTQLTRAPDAWWATLTCQLVVERGPLDVLRLRVPTTWVGPFEVQSSVPVSVEVAARDQQPTTIALRLAEPIPPGQALDLHIRGPLAQESAAPIAVPGIVAEAPSRWRNFVSVPLRLDSQPIAWTEVGVRPAEMPRELRAAGAVPESWRTLEVIATPFRVALQPTVGERPAASARLAETAVATGPLDGQLMVTWMIVASQGLTECVLQLPNAQELVSVNLDGQPAPIRPSAERRWQVPLGPARLPQVLEIVCRSAGNHRRGGRQIELLRPILLADDTPIPVELSLWSFGHPKTSSNPRIEGAAVVTAVDQAALRLDRLVGIAEAATPAAAELPLPDGYNWYRPWATWLSMLRQEALEASSRSARDQAASQISHSSEEQLAAAADRLDAWIEQCEELLAWPDLEEPLEQAAADQFSAWPLAQQAAEDWTYCVADGGADRLVIDLSPTSATPGQIQVAGLSAIIGLALAAVWLIRRPAAGDFLCRWPHAIGFLSGLTYWAWLWPSWLGLLIAAGSLLLALRPGWPGRSLRSEGSTVLQVGRPT